MREHFQVPKEAECRVWHRYMSSTYEELNKPEQTLQDAGLYAGQVSLCKGIAAALGGERDSSSSWWGKG